MPPLFGLSNAVTSTAPRITNGLTGPTVTSASTVGSSALLPTQLFAGSPPAVTSTPQTQLASTPLISAAEIISSLPSQFQQLYLEVKAALQGIIGGGAAGPASPINPPVPTSGFISPAIPPVVSNTAFPTTSTGGVNNQISILDPAIQQQLIQGYIQNNDAQGNLEPAGINADSNGRGLASFITVYAAEVKEVSKALAQGQPLSSASNRGNNPAGMADSLGFDGSAADTRLMARMAYKNGTYNNGVFGNYDLPRIVEVYEQRVGPLSAADRRQALSSEVFGMGLLHFMESNGFIGDNEVMNPDGSSPLGFWPNTPRDNAAYLTAVQAVQNGTIANDVRLSLAGNPNTVGRLDDFVVANYLGLNSPDNIDLSISRTISPQEFASIRQQIQQGTLP